VTGDESVLLLAPECLQRGLVGEVVARLEKRGFQMVTGRLFPPKKQPQTVSNIGRGPVLATLWRGEGAVKSILDIAGADEALPGTIRGDLCVAGGKKLVYPSTSAAKAAEEAKLWFPKDQMVNWKKVDEPWLYEGFEFEEEKKVAITLPH